MKFFGFKFKKKWGRGKILTRMIAVACKYSQGRSGKASRFLTGLD